MGPTRPHGHQLGNDSGRYDHQLTVVAEDLEAYGVFSGNYINGLPSVKEVYTSFVLKQVKVAANPPLPG